MAYREFLPDPRLRQLVRIYWEIEEHHAPNDEEHRFMPERSVRLTFYSGQSWQGPLAQKLEMMPHASLSGLNLEPLRMVSQGMTRALGVELYPWGARQLFGWEIEMTQLDLTAAFWPISRAIHALLSLGAWLEARHMLEDWLLRLHSERAREPGAGVSAATALYQSLGQTKIGRLAEELSLSQRQLERLFAAEVGVNAKTLARLIRFEEVHNRIYSDPNASLAGLAYELGFADQAHLNREFRALAQVTPRAFAEFARQQRATHSEEVRLVEATLGTLSTYGISRMNAEVME